MDHLKKQLAQGRGGGQVDSMLAFYSEDLSLNPARAYNFFGRFLFEKKENKQREARIGPLKICTEVCCKRIDLSSVLVNARICQKDEN